MSEMSENIQEYFDSIEKDVEKAYGLAGKARAKGYDVDDKVSITIARNMAERVEGIISVAAPQIKDSGVSKRIFELEKDYGTQDWRVAFSIALEVAQQRFCVFKDEREAMEVGLRIGFSYITVGVVSSPLEGFIRLELKDVQDGSGKFFSLYFGGPIRSAGTTAICAFVALSDYIRKNMGYKVYDPTENEIKRSSTEVDFFHDRITNLQYHPSREETEYITRHWPVQIEGDPSEKLEVPNYKDLPRVSTNKMRNGYCLVLAEGLALKTAKFWGKFSRWNKEFGMGHWSFAQGFVDLQKEVRSKGEKGTADTEKVKPDYGYIKDLVAGRPVFGYPMKSGAFRLRYGRTRTSGFSTDAMHPATMYLLNGFIAFGTQLKVERPGKATTITTCDSIEGPTVKLKDGSVVFVDTLDKAKEINKDVVEIIYSGDVLINYGDFLDRAHVLVPPGYCEEWWLRELENVCKDKEKIQRFLDDFNAPITCKEAVVFCKEYNIPLHPRYTFYWREVSSDDVKSLIDWIKHSEIEEEKIILPLDYKYRKDLSENNPKRVLELLGVPHSIVTNEYVLVEDDYAEALKVSLGMFEKDIKGEFENGLEYVQQLSDVKLRDKSGLFVGMRMGRPEKGKMRKMTGSPQGLFPVGEEGGRLRCFQAALEKGKVTCDLSVYYCSKCESETIYPRCHKCDGIAEKKGYHPDKGIVDEDEEGARPYKKMELDIREYFDSALKKIGFRNYPDLIKGVRGISNKGHYPEHLVKTILRAKHNIYANKDATTRFDMTEMGCTHFKPFEVGTSIKKLRELGYRRDVYGKELLSDDQILELKCQDVILPACPVSPDEGADVVLASVANFLDELLESFYGVEKFYNVKCREDIVGHLIIGLSPHTAAGIIGRIIGFSQTQTFITHPFFHSIMRRDCDGDEAGCMLLMDALLNFSPKMLSNHRGATQDEPLVLTSTLIPSEVDDMVFNMDVAWNYPLEFYEGCLEYKLPWEVKVEIIKNRLGKPEQFEGYGFTHPDTNFNGGTLCSAYKTLPTMQEKVESQMDLAEKLRAADENDVARLIIERHFLRDLKGNLRKFSQQVFRCVHCNEKFRRPPLKGVCTKCSGKIIFTISEGSIIKYLEPCLNLLEKYELQHYLRQSIELLQQRIDTLFGKDPEKQEGLNKWFDS